MRFTTCLLASAALIAGCASTVPITAGTSSAPPQARPCPAEVPQGARCYAGEDGAGSHYLIAIPAGWSAAQGVLVMHAHGGPADTGPAHPARAEEDLKRWAVTVKAGYAWAGSTYRRGGYGVTMAAEDTERLRQIFVRAYGQPRRTLLHGQSYGGGVASKAVELFAGAGGRPGPYDGVLLTNAVLGGGAVAYNFRLDLRVVYQSVCKNHPREDEPAYPLWMGLPDGSKLTRAELANRVDECTGVRKPATQRTAQQQDNLATILGVVKIPERSLIGHLNWATWLFHDVTQLRLGGRNPFSNEGVVYQGSRDDAGLNARVLRYAADRRAVDELARDSAPHGRITAPVLSLHAINDPTAFVELESAYRAVVERSGASGMLVQAYSDESEHSYLAEAQYPALFTALLEWIDKKEKPTPQKVLSLCRSYEAAYGPGCKIQPAYVPPALDSRVAPRR
jgi:hypothetical protein